MKYSLYVVLATAPVLAQSLSIGVKAGIPPGTAFNASSLVNLTSNAQRYLVGGTVELHLPLRFSVELDGIYKRTGYSTFLQSLGIGSITSRVAANQWEFPVLAKYEILGGPVRPFIDAGPVLRHLSGITDSSTYLSLLPSTANSIVTTTNNSPDLLHRNTPGVAVGAGITLKLSSIRISPEIRYTRWGTNTFQIGQSRSSTSNPNQEDVIFGITF